MADEQKKETRAPVVVVLGHIDHGKTSLLDYIKKTKVAEKEAGGITQHIGAYEAEFRQKKITFIDTPGHEAFSKMRQRGAEVADIAILVIDASEGVKEQTKEAINTIKAAAIPFIIALNKVDKPQAQPEYVMAELEKYGVKTEQRGGKTPALKISAKTGQGVDELLELILLLAEIENLQADTSIPAEGLVIESSLDSRKGPVATLLLKNGVLKEGDFVRAGLVAGKIRKMTDFLGKEMKQVLPSQPVQVLGFKQVPLVGEKFEVLSEPIVGEEEKKTVMAEARIREKAENKAGEIFPRRREGREEEKKSILRIILKTDCLGSLEAVKAVLEALPQKEVVLEIVRAEVGEINISDIQLAESVGARIIGFRTKIDKAAQPLSQQKKIIPKTFEVIYELIEEVRKLMEKIKVPEKQRVDLGKIKIVAIFKNDKKGQIIGGRVVEGEIARDVLAEVFRDEELVGKGRIKSIEQEKKAVSKATKGQEVGMLFVGEVNVQENDFLVIYKETFVGKEEKKEDDKERKTS